MLRKTKEGSSRVFHTTLSYCLKQSLQMSAVSPGVLQTAGMKIRVVSPNRGGLFNDSESIELVASPSACHEEMK